MQNNTTDGPALGDDSAQWEDVAMDIMGPEQVEDRRDEDLDIVLFDFCDIVTSKCVARSLFLCSD